MNEHHFWLAGAWLLLIVVVAVLLVAFEVWMIVDAALNKKLTDKAKALWIVGMFVVHPFVGIVYFFTDRHKR